MPDLDFGESDEEAILVLKGFAHRVNADLYNHGTRGLLTSFNTFMADHAAREDEQEKAQALRHQENSDKLAILSADMSKKTFIWNVAGVLVAIAALCSMFFLAWLGMRMKQGALKIPSISSSTGPIQAYSSGTDAGNSTAYTAQVR
jgi:hypothetical protein